MREVMLLTGLQAGEQPGASCHLGVSPRGGTAGGDKSLQTAQGTNPRGLWQRRGDATSVREDVVTMGPLSVSCTSSLLALLSLTPLLYFTVTYSVCISFIESQKLFSS